LSVSGVSTSLPQVHNHTVQFYGNDGALLHELMSHIGRALSRGSSAIIIATSAHIEGLARKLKSQGIDVARAKADSRYVALEATDVLSKFMVNGLPDRVLFSDAIGQVIARAAAASLDESRRVVAFGEMVALLWAEGKCEAAIQLENLWNELAKTYSFSLHCAYPMQGFSRQEMDDSLRKICAEHTGVVLDGSPSTIASEGHRSITKLKQDGSVLPKIEWHEREEPFGLFVETVREYAIFMLDPNGRIASWNAGAERIKGYRASEIIGQHFSIFYPKEDVGSGKPQRLLAVAESEGHVEDEGWRIRKDGTRFWANVTITAIRDASGSLIGFGKVTRDLTDQRRSEVALRRSEERSRLFVDAVKDYAIFMLDPEGCVCTWNTGAERIKGYKASEIIGQHFSCFYPEQDIRAGKPAWELDVAAKEGRFEDEGWRVRKDGSRFWANVIITPIRDSAGDLLGFTKVTRDFTERMFAQKSLEESRLKLQESEKSLRDLSLHLLRTQDEERRRIGREIHDSLGQYLSVLKMKLDSMGSSQATAEENRECANLVEECVKEVRTISYLLYPPMLEEMGLTSAIPWYLEGFSKRSGIKTSFGASEDLGRLSRDAELVLFRVLQESLTNVQRHSGSKTADIRISHGEGAVTLEVVDQGKGLPNAILEQANQDWMGSLGVGVRGMSERLRQLGGTLEMSSDESGTRLRATVPFQELPSATTAST
jgi:PAS domain S-box-containing protein